MHPILASFHLGGAQIALRSYGTFMVLAWVVALAVGTVVAWRRGFRWRRVLVTFVIALVAGVVGSRLLDLVVNWGYYSTDHARIYATQFTGFSLYGGLILALVVAALLARAWRLPLWRLADSAVPALAAGIMLMRAGCFLNGCCFGITTRLPWGVAFPPGSPAWAEQILHSRTGLVGLLTGNASVRTVQPVHPTQLYELAAAFAFAGIAVWSVRRRDPDGVPFLLFALGFTLFRLGNNFLRVQLPTFALPIWFYPALYLTISAGVALALAWRLRLVKWPASGADSARRTRYPASPRL
jgi:phosphatidylglycerol---prolipoprotein diacylglyceryl transferase